MDQSRHKGHYTVLGQNKNSVRTKFDSENQYAPVRDPPAIEGVGGGQEERG